MERHFAQAVKIALIVLLCLTAKVGQTAFEPETGAYRWFKGWHEWCVETGQSQFCIPFEVEVDSIQAGSVRFRQKAVDGSVPILLLFIHDKARRFSELTNTDEQISFIESYEISGGTAKKYRAGVSTALELEMDNGIAMILFGDNFDELLNVANIISTKSRNFSLALS